MSLLAATARTFAAAVVVSLYVLLLGPPCIIWTLISRDARFIYAAGGLGVRLGFALAGIHVRVDGAEHIQRQTAAVYAANHSSNIEPPALFISLAALFPRLRIVYKAELRKIPVLVWVFDVAGFVPIERANRGQSLPAVDRATDAIRAGHSFLIFPEGTRSRTGDLLPFKKGGFVMAINAQAPIVPVVVSGARAAMRKGSPLIWPVTVTVEFSPPVSTIGKTIDDRDALIAAVREPMERILRRNRPDAVC